MKSTSFTLVSLFFLLDGAHAFASIFFAHLYSVPSSLFFHSYYSRLFSYLGSRIQERRPTNIKNSHLTLHILRFHRRGSIGHFIKCRALEGRELFAGTVMNQLNVEAPIEQIGVGSDASAAMATVGAVEIVNEAILKEEAVSAAAEEEGTCIVEEQILEEEVVSFHEEGTVVVAAHQPEARHQPMEEAGGAHQVFVDQSGVGGSCTAEYVIPDDTLAVQEEVVIGENGAHYINDVASNETVVYSANGEEEEVVQLKEEEIIGTPSSEMEMSVAMDLAKLSQGHFENNHYSVTHSPSPIMPPQPPQLEPKITPHPPCGVEKPRLSYAQMIAEALMQAEDRMLPLCEIYTYINQKYPYFRMDVKSWQNAIRHNLTLNPSFQKVPRPNNEGRGNFWRMEDGAERQIFKRTIRSHHYKIGSSGGGVGIKHQQQKKVVLVSPQDELNAATTSIVEATVPVATATEDMSDTAIVVSGGGGVSNFSPSAPATSSSTSTSILASTSGVKNVQTVTLSKALLQKNAVQTVGGQQIVFIALPAGTKVAASS